jgi:HAD superfamily hydrolase (TIGR01549 family)
MKILAQAISSSFGRSSLSGVRTVCVDLWGTVARSDNKEPILDLQGILGYKVDSINPSNLDSVDQEFLDACLTTNVHSTEGFLNTVAAKFDLAVAPHQVASFQKIVDEESICASSFFDATNAIKALKDVGFQLSLISNLWPFPVECLFKEANLGQYFPREYRVYSFEEGISKPDPELYRRAYRRCGVEPHECLMVGDNLANDILPALAVGMKACLVDRKGRYSAAEIPEGVIVVRDMEELLPMLLPHAPVRL